jgi:hypothetical protein
MDVRYAESSGLSARAPPLLSLTDAVEKVFPGKQTKFSRAADAFRFMTITLLAVDGSVGPTAFLKKPKRCRSTS